MGTYRHNQVHNLTGTEADLIYRLLSTFRLITPSDPTPHIRSSFCHRPNSIIVNRTPFAAQCGWTLDELDWQWRFQLVTQWICVLVQATPCLDFDGSDSGTEKVVKGTGLSPREFVRAYLEAENSLGRAFRHVGVSVEDNKSDKSGASLVDAMLDLWTEKTKHWRALPLGQFQAEWETSKRFGGDCIREAGTVLKSIYGELRPGNALQHARAMLARAVQTKGTFDCIAHPGKIFCDCPTAFEESIVVATAVRWHFVDGWVVELIKFDEAFFFNGDGAAKILLPCGGTITAEDLAERYLDDPVGLQQYFTLKVPREAVIDLMLKFWHHQSLHWRSHNRTRAEARTCFLERLRNRAAHSRTFIAGQLVDPTFLNHSLQDDMVRAVRFGSYDHRPWVLLYPVLDGEGCLQYKLLRYVPCHRDCKGWEPLSDKALQSYVEEFAEEDEERARRVVPDW